MLEPLQNRIQQILEPSLSAEGISIVQVRLMGGQNRPTVQIMVEHSDGGRVTLDECAKVSRSCGAILDVEDALSGAYVLEISSPGIDRPLVKPEDYAKFLGQMAKIETRHLIEGRKRFHGKLERADGESVTINQDNNSVAIPLMDIVSAKLAMSDTALAKQPKKVIKKNS
ncbi:MAG: ribosome maturation factor RimP [Alphaproteobacteria bacterium]|nr:MAG: ribosome maturation factor RimP [Alphaproteobacteria bacterium]